LKVGIYEMNIWRKY